MGNPLQDKLMRQDYLEQLLQYGYDLDDIKDLPTSELVHKIFTERAKREECSVWF